MRWYESMYHGRRPLGVAYVVASRVCRALHCASSANTATAGSIVSVLVHSHCFVAVCSFHALSRIVPHCGCSLLQLVLCTSHIALQQGILLPMASRVAGY